MVPHMNSPESSRPKSEVASVSPPGSSSSSPYERPQPRPPKTPAHAARIRVRNRRREWLSRHPSYFRSLEHELADPVLYDALIRRFQSHEQREEEGRIKGFGRVLEVDLLRGEARLSKMVDSAPLRANGGEAAISTGGNDLEASNAPEQGEDPRDTRTPQLSRPGSSSSSRARRRSGSGSAPETDMNWEELEALETHDLEKRAAPQTAEEGRTRWDEFLRLRFITGRDDDFDYRVVDEDDEYDSLERREQEDAWFDNEEPSWVGESDDDDDDNADDAGSKGKGDKMNVERPLTGETGVQDF